MAIICCKDKNPEKEWIECDECYNSWHYQCLMVGHGVKLKEIRTHEDGGDIWMCPHCVIMGEDEVEYIKKKKRKENNNNNQNKNENNIYEDDLSEDDDDDIKCDEDDDSEYEEIETESLNDNGKKRRKRKRKEKKKKTTGKNKRKKERRKKKKKKDKYKLTSLNIQWDENDILPLEKYPKNRKIDAMEELVLSEAFKIVYDGMNDGRIMDVTFHNGFTTTISNKIKIFYDKLISQNPKLKMYNCRSARSITSAIKRLSSASGKLTNPNVHKVIAPMYEKFVSEAAAPKQSGMYILYLFYYNNF